MAGHLLGYVQDADIQDSRPADFKEYDYYIPDDVRRDGLEKTMDNYLRGKPGVRELQFNEKGRFVGEIGYTPPTSGMDVYLTLDLDIQYAVENALRKIHRGAAVVIDPNTGNILAMASIPSFDPQKFIPKVDDEVYDAYLKNKTAPLVNRAISELPDDLRTAIILREIDGLSYDEIAQVMECPVGTVRSRIFRAREAIDKRIRPLVDETADDPRSEDE